MILTTKLLPKKLWTDLYNSSNFRGETTPKYIYGLYFCSAPNERIFSVHERTKPH